ncbi:MAG: hypothetical protein ACJ77A_05475 [Actinomycetota bacterium]
MGPLLATGGTVPFNPASGHIDFSPLVTVILALVAVRLMFGIRLTGPVVGGVALGGTLLSGAIQAWGVAIPTAVALAAGAITSSLVHRQARGRRAPA